MDILVVVIAVVYTIKRSTIKGRIFSDSDGTRRRDFDEWKRLELRRLNVFLLILWSWEAIEAVTVVPSYLKTRDEDVLLFGWIALPVLVIASIIYSVQGQEARKLKKAFASKTGLHAS